MKYLNRIIYLGYYFRETEYSKFKSFLDYTSKLKKISKVKIIVDMFVCIFKYNISILEYFQFRFFDKNHEERLKWAGTGFMYETILKLNPKENRTVLSDKKIFLNYYKDFVKHWHVTIQELENDLSAVHNKISPNTEKIVLKSSFGQCGRGIEVVSFSNKTNGNNLIKLLKKSGNDIIEQFVQQHDSLNQLSPSGLNTLRIITTLNTEGKVDILGARLRITVNSHVDNLAAGNMACEVELETGKVIGPGVFSDITKQDAYSHPITGVEIVGFQIPMFKESVELVTQAALFDTNNRSIGWDVAITNHGPELIEGNDNWCKLLWQLPAKKGLKSVLEGYIK